MVAQSCLVSDSGDIPFRVPSGYLFTIHTQSQIIVTSYRFQCSGNVTRWQTYVYPPYLNGFYSITFQVWRPAADVATTGCYSLVGQDLYRNIVNAYGLVDRTVPSSTIISVQPGDVVGYFVSRNDNAIYYEGIILTNEDAGEQVWYSDANPRSLGGVCPFPVGNIEGAVLIYSTNKAPAFPIDIGESHLNSIT